MLDKKIFAMGIAVLKASFPNSKVTTDDCTMDVWYELLSDLDTQQFQEGIKQVVKNSRFFPSIAEIRETSLGTGQQSTEAKALQAWQKVKIGVRRAGYMNSVKFDDPVVHNVLAGMGGWKKFCSLPEEDERFYRPQFLKSYAAFSRLEAQGRLRQIPYLPGEAEIYNQGHGLDQHVRPPLAITDKTVIAARKYTPTTMAELPEKPGEVMSSTEAKVEVKVLVDSLVQKGEAA